MGRNFTPLALRNFFIYPIAFKLFASAVLKKNDFITNTSVSYTKCFVLQHIKIKHHLVLTEFCTPAPVTPDAPVQDAVPDTAPADTPAADTTATAQNVAQNAEPKAAAPVI